jgi:hypothetical protein
MFIGLTTTTSVIYCYLTVELSSSHRRSHLVMVRLIIILLLVEYFFMEVPRSGASSSRLVNLYGFLNSEELWSDRCNIKRRMLSTITQQNFQLPDIPVVYENDIFNLDGYDEVFYLFLDTAFPCFTKVVHSQGANASIEELPFKLSF